jgi:hypothetical protein
LRVAVVGGGIFGCTAAIHAQRAGHEVHLFEKTNGLMHAASAVNQFRLHYGYHYPRSAETITECREGVKSFLTEYGDCVVAGKTVYAVAKDGSRLRASEYIQALEENGLPFDAADFANQNLAVAIAGREARIEPANLRRLVADRLPGIILRYRAPAYRGMRDEFDAIIVACYAGSNDVALELGYAVEPFQYEVIEKPVIQLPAKYKDFSIVVMDGEFCSLDPYGSTGLHLMGHVKHAIHSSNTGLEPEVADELVQYLNSGIIKDPKGSRWPQFLEAGKQFIPALKRAEYLGSMFTVRAVLPDMDKTDARPTLVERMDEQVIRVFSGKIGTCVDAARMAVEMIGRQQQKAV